jgi:dsRNA-specific ribonuclease
MLTTKQKIEQRGAQKQAAILALPSPPVSSARKSARLAALHARLALPQKLPLETLARCLVDASADSHPKFNNASLATLGGDLLSYYTSEFIVAKYPRLPLAVVFAAMYAYCGPKALQAITREWGVELAAHPGGEVDPGYLQFERRPAEPKDIELKFGPEVQTNIKGEHPEGWRQGISMRAVYSDPFGRLTEQEGQKAEDSEGNPLKGVTAETASTNFVRALLGAIYLHAGRTTAKKFFRDHFRSRQLNMSSLFQFRFPAKDLNKLCAREGFQSPVARIIAETGRKSRHPVFIVGVFSGNDKLGEGAGASLSEARVRAAVAALKGWYLYSPLEVRVPSEMEEEGSGVWEGIMVDGGDVVA